VKNVFFWQLFIQLMQTLSSQLTQLLPDGTVLEEWFSPMARSIDKQRFSAKQFSALPMAPFILTGCLRHLLASCSLRDYLQTLFHIKPNQSMLPVARSTWADALAHPLRRDTLRLAMTQLVTHARAILPDRLAHIEGLGTRPVIATDATYQTESTHFQPHYPMQGGEDNQKGHMLLTHYDLRHGIPLNAVTQTQSMGEMRVLKQEETLSTSWMRTPNAIHVVDRAFVDGRFWDQRLKCYGSTVITRTKSILKLTLMTENPVIQCGDNAGILYDRVVSLLASTEKWRVIGFQSPDGVIYEYLTNDHDLLPGIVAFLYHRRWDKEKYYDCFKNDLAGSKAWGKSPVAIEQQALLGIVTVILTCLFLHRRQAELQLTIPNSTQATKHNHKQVKPSLSGERIMLRALWQQLAKITRQVWRFLKNCFTYKHEHSLYERQLEPLLRGYL
jgi:hypothetical protein